MLLLIVLQFCFLHKPLIATCKCTHGLLFIIYCYHVINKTSSILFSLAVTNLYWIAKLDALSQSNPAMCPNVNCMRKYNGMQRKKLLKRHLMYECGVPKQFRCFECNKKFAKNYSLKQHMINVHRLLFH